MKKKMSILIALVFLTMPFSSSFAQTNVVKADKKEAAVKAEVIKGEIVSIDVAKGEVVIKDSATGTEKTVIVEPKTIALMKPGEKVKVSLKAGTNVAERVKKLVEKKHKK
jgi:hypothetical protein